MSLPSIIAGIAIGIIIGALAVWILKSPVGDSDAGSGRASILTQISIGAVERFESTLKVQFTLMPNTPEDYLLRATPYVIDEYPDGPPGWEDCQEIESTSPQCLQVGSDETHVVVYALYTPSAHNTAPITDVSSDPCQQTPTC